MNRKEELKALRQIKRTADMFSQLNGWSETFLDPIVDKLAMYMDLHFDCNDFTKAAK